MLPVPARRPLLCVPRFVQVRYTSGPAASPSAGATASSSSFKNREQGEEAYYVQLQDKEKLKKYKEKIEAHKKEIEKLKGQVEDLENKK